MGVGKSDNKSQLDPNGPAAFDSETPTGQPPPYREDGSPPRALPPDLSQRLQNLNLSRPEGAALPTPQQLVAHLKLLESIFSLRTSVGLNEGLFDIAAPSGSKSEDPKLRVRTSEKRWQVYVTRAVSRFEKWWETAIPSSFKNKPCATQNFKDYVSKKSYYTIATDGEPLMHFTRDNLPPLDVLMVWHAYTLNPRCFLDDCIRFGKMDFYAMGMPWPMIDAVIDPKDFEYSPSKLARANFESLTGLSWDNLHDQPAKKLDCPGCLKEIHVAWTSGAGFVDPSSDEFKPGTGYADSDFVATCRYCTVTLTHDTLRLAKFRKDVQQLRDRDLPLPGTLLEPTGKPPKLKTVMHRLPYCVFPNTILKASLGKTVLEETRMDSKVTRAIAPGMSTVKILLEAAVNDRKFIKEAQKSSGGYVYQGEKVAVRKVMSKYWYNSSPFGLDLTGAVIRQGSFIEKMHNIDWLHSPALMTTMARCVTKYERFFAIMKRWPRHVAVPTLDIDLAWHTHQTCPPTYYAYSDQQTSRFIDHDDKIEETKLSTFFTWTSKEYQQRWGEPYSECTCWYCEAVRESHTSSASRLFGTANARASETLHASADDADPAKSPHISAHNAVKDYDSEAKAKVHAAHLDKAYQKACARARKEGRREPRRDDYYYYYYAWGYPYPMVPMYGYVPYGVDPCTEGGAAVYAADPCSVDSTAGAYGSCAAGTCGGTAAAGACAGGGGSSCGTAACGSGGGGGGGGGCGGGGGGGGGGCGGGGGGC